MSTKYDVALSFAAEDRSVARQIAEALKKQNINVFFDSHSSAELWGRNLYEYLRNIYTQTKLCIVLISKNYNEEQWTTLEWRNLLAHSVKHPSFTILPIRLDRSEVPQDVANVGYIPWKPESLPKLTNTVKNLLAKYEPPKSTSEHEIIHVIKRVSGWSVKREGASRATSVHKTQKQAIESARKLARRTSDSSVIVHTKDGSIKSHERL
jgi:uncharacterized protein DUF2188/TIR domain-containing protein